MHKDLRLSLFALILSHIQLLVGLILYFVSPSGLNAIQSLGMGGLNAQARLLALEHPVINIIAFVKDCVSEKHIIVILFINKLIFQIFNLHFLFT